MYAVKPQTAQRVSTNQIQSGVDSDRSLQRPAINQRLWLCDLHKDNERSSSHRVSETV